MVNSEMSRCMEGVGESDCKQSSAEFQNDSSCTHIVGAYRCVLEVRVAVPAAHCSILRAFGTSWAPEGKIIGCIE